MMKSLDQALETLCMIYLRISQVLLAIMVVGIFSEVVMRYFLGTGILGSGEIWRLTITWIVFLMSVVLFRRRRHIIVSALVDLLPATGRRVCALITNASVIVLSGFVLYQLYQVYPYLTLHTPVFGLSDKAFKFAPIFAFVPIAAQCLVNIAHGDSVEGAKDI